MGHGVQLKIQGVGHGGRNIEYSLKAEVMGEATERARGGGQVMGMQRTFRGGTAGQWVTHPLPISG